MALFKSMAEIANTVGTMLPGTIVPIPLELANFYSIITFSGELHTLAILTCPGCGRGGLRVPDGRRGKVTCPRCGAEWFYPETIELSEVEFRCSQTGARFIVQLTRRSPLHKFVVQGIKNAPPRQPVKEEAAEPPKSETVGNQGAALNRLSGPNPGRWLASMFETAGLPGAISRSTTIVEQATTSAMPKPLSYDANKYNWASFFCPYCNASGFIKCGAGHLVCDSTVELRNGRRFHQCFCANAGFIAGTIKTIEANQHTFERVAVASTKTSSAVPVKEASASALNPPPKKSDKRLLR
jgi:hypothetical protein